jgi:hypothetical protein
MEEMNKCPPSFVADPDVNVQFSMSENVPTGPTYTNPPSVDALNPLAKELFVKVSEPLVHSSTYSNPPDEEAAPLLNPFDTKEAEPPTFPKYTTPPFTVCEPEEKTDKVTDTDPEGPMNSDPPSFDADPDVKELSEMVTEDPTLPT